MVDVIVVGGGPAGAASALELAEAGFVVTLVERATFPRRKVCGEYLSTGALVALERLGLLPAVRASGTALAGVRLVAGGAAEAILPFARGALACPREALDEIVLRAAQRAGATVLTGRVDGLLFEAGRVAGVRGRDADGEPFELRARWTVGADGCGSAVARAAGLTRTPSRRPRFALGGHYACAASDELVEMYVGEGTYLAINPLGAGLANVMAVVPQPALKRWSGDPDAGIAAHAAGLSRNRRVVTAAQRRGERVAVGPLAHDVSAAGAPGLLLVGDAAGFVDPFTGQGVFLALCSAAAAAAAIRAAAATANGEQRAWREYAGRQAARLRARRGLGAAVGLLVDVAPLARRAAANLAHRPRTAAALADLLAGVGGPQRGLDPALLGALVL